MFLQDNDVDGTGRPLSRQESIVAAPSDEAFGPRRSLVHTPISLSPRTPCIQLPSDTPGDGLLSASYANGEAPLSEKGEVLPVTARSDYRMPESGDEVDTEKSGKSGHLAPPTAQMDSIVPDGSSKRLYQLTKRFSAAHTLGIR